jgi:starvation-inducible DNA-binding protein
MATSETHAHLPAFSEHERNEAGHLLQLTVVELIALSLVGKHLHWNIVGSGFRDFHLHLDELVDEWRGLSDTAAERAVAIGYAADGRAPTVAELSALRATEPGPVSVQVAVRELAERVAEVDERVRERAGRLADVDLASQDVLTEIIRALEKQLWMIRSQLSHG